MTLNGLLEQSPPPKKERLLISTDVNKIGSEAQYEDLYAVCNDLLDDDVKIS